MTTSAGLVIFTDLDGTLLDHHSYDWSPAMPALSQVREHRIPLILNSSKTAPEIAHLRAQLSNVDPYIVENGAAVIVPAHYFESAEREVKTFGTSRDQVLAVLSDCRSQGFRFQGFADMTVDELAERTGLAFEAAERAMDRIATEPLVWEDTDDALRAFQAVLAQHDLNMLRGGRFLHVMGRFDKADGLRWLMQRYRQHATSELKSVALGDSPNDWQMLAAADIAVVIRSDCPANELPSGGQFMIYSNHRGPTGWNECVLSILNQHGYAYRPTR